MATIKERIRAFVDPSRAARPATPVDFDEARRIAEQVRSTTGASAVHVDPETGRARYSLDGGRTWTWADEAPAQDA